MGIVSASTTAVVAIALGPFIVLKQFAWQKTGGSAVKRALLITLFRGTHFNPLYPGKVSPV